MSSVFRQSARIPAATAESDVNDYLDAFEAAAGRRRAFLLHEPMALVRAMRRVSTLERIVVSPSRTAEGALFRRILQAMRSRVHTPLHAVAAVLTIPERAGEYEAGSSKQTLRRKVRDAQRRGISWAAVEDRALRRGLMELADIHERTHDDARYRNGTSEHSELVDHGFWLVARASDGDPLLLSVTPIDGELGALRYFRTLRSGEEATVARYLMTQVLVEQLRLRGVQRLLDTTPSMRLPHGLRHFQRMVGFRLMRVTLRPEARSSSARHRIDPGRGPVAPLASILRDRGVLRGAVVACIAAFGSEVLPAVLTF
jgi:hypothetical protein